MRIPPAPPHPPASEPEEEVADIDELYHQHAAAVASLGLAMLGKSDEAEDLVQEVFMRAWRGLETLRHPRAAKSWLLTIAVRVAHTRLSRRRFTRLFLPAGDVEIEQIATSETGPDEKVAVRQLVRILERMPADLRAAWTLRHVQSETVEEVAALCGWSLSTTKRRLHAAHRRMLRRIR